MSMNTANLKITTSNPIRTSTITSSSTSQPSENVHSRKRTSLAPRPPLSIHPSVVVGPHVQITGNFPVHIDAESIIHPYAKIHAWAGEVKVGKGCIISERVILGTGAEEGDLKDERDIKSEEDRKDDDKGIYLGCNVVLESGVVVREGCRIGDMSIVDVEGRLGTGCRVGRYCKINSTLTLYPRSMLPDCTVAYGIGTSTKTTDSTLLAAKLVDIGTNKDEDKNSTYAMRIDKTTRDNPNLIPALKMKSHGRMLELQRRLVENHISKWQ